MYVDAQLNVISVGIFLHHFGYLTYVNVRVLAATFTVYCYNYSAKNNYELHIVLCSYILYIPPGIWDLHTEGRGCVNAA